MQIVSIFSILLLISNYSNSQKVGSATKLDSTKHQRIYQISKSDFQQIELIENLNGTFQGTLTNTIWKMNRKEERIRTIQQVLNIPAIHVEQLMNICYMNDIENLPSCEDVNGYVHGLDGTSISFGIQTHELNRNYYYWELENNHYQDSTITETKKVRMMLSSIHERMSLKRLFNMFTNKLPSGKYAFGGIIMEKRKV